MFARELQEAGNIIGLGMECETDMVNDGKMKVRRNGAQTETLSVEAVRSNDFPTLVEKKYPDFILLAVRNPVSEAVKFYYRQLQGRDKFPALVISQNGLSVIDDSRAALKEALGQDANKVSIIRVSLINGIDAKIENGAMTVSYKLPIKLGLGVSEGLESAADDLAAIFKESGFKAQKFQGSDVFKMENSKLFTNLIGMAAAVNGVTVSTGFQDKKIFKQEVAMLKEYVLAVKAGDSGFVGDFAGYPIKFLARIMLLPVSLLAPIRGIFERVVVKGRNRPKDLSEIDYYNGEAVKLGRKFKVATPVNEMIVAKAKEINKK